MPWIALIAVLALAGCIDADLGGNAATMPEMAGWQLASGKSPSNAEFAALAATCQAKGGAVDACLTELGLKRAK